MLRSVADIQLAPCDGCGGTRAALMLSPRCCSERCDRYWHWCCASSTTVNTAATMLRSRGRQRPAWLVEGAFVGANLIYFLGVRGAIAQSSAVISPSQAYVPHGQSGTLACSLILALCYRPALGHVQAVAAVRRRRKALLSALTSKHSVTPYARHPSYPSGHYSNKHINHITPNMLSITKSGGARHAQCLTKPSPNA